MTAVINSLTPTSLEEFIDQICPPNNQAIREALFRYSDVVKTLIKDLETPLHDQLPNDIKVYHNGQLQKWFEYEAHFPRYFVKAVPNFQFVPAEKQVYVHDYFDGVLAKFGVYKTVLIDRVSPQQGQLIIDVLDQQQ